MIYGIDIFIVRAKETAKLLKSPGFAFRVPFARFLSGTSKIKQIQFWQHPTMSLDVIGFNPSQAYFEVLVIGDQHH